MGEDLGDALRRRRLRAGLTQEELAERAGIHRTYLSDVERGSRNLSLINIERLAESLEMKMSDLFKLVDR
jgi:transcriptional regulator with XRE-family HTH domain